MLPEQRSWHFGVLSSTGTGHINPLIALSQELAQRGHQVTFFDQPKVEARIREAGLGLISIGAPDRTGFESPPSKGAGLRHEIAMLRANLARVTHSMKHYLERTPPAVGAAGVDALLVDEIALTGPTIAQMLGLPYFLLSTSVPRHFGWRSSSWITGYRSSETALSWLQGAFLEASALCVRGPLRETLDRLRSDRGLGPTRRISREYPSLAHITQMPECLDLDRRAVAADFYYSGPWLNSGARQSVLFPWDRLDGRGVAYVTLGTTRNAQPETYRRIAEACGGLDLQLVIALGDRFESTMFEDLPGRPIVVRFAPQLELLKIAEVVIAHGGCNTSLETLHEGKPMVVIPLAWDQPAVAARLRRAKVAEVVPVMRLSVERMRRAVTQVLREPRYRRAAEDMRTRLAALDGTRHAADIIAVELAGYAARCRLEPQEPLGAGRGLARAASYHPRKPLQRDDAVI